MINLYDQLCAWQKLPRAYEDWSRYRGELTDAICQCMHAGTNLLILGAGSCNDIDIPRLSARFSKLYLLDKHFDEADKARLCKQATNLEYLEEDLFGITDESWRSFCDALQDSIRLRGRATDIECFTDEALRELEKRYESRKKAAFCLPKRGIDYILAAGLHSQINNMAAWIYDAYCQALGQRSMRFFGRVQQENDRFIPEWNDMLLDGAKKGVFFALERSRIGVEGSVQGAAQGIAYAEHGQSKARLGYEVKLNQKAVWNFDLRQQIAYEMDFIYMERKGENG